MKEGVNELYNSRKLSKTIISKKYRILLFGCISLILSSCRGNLTAKYVEPLQPDRNITIVIATDLHYLSPSLTDYGDYFMNLIQNSDGKLTHYSPTIIAAFVEEVLEISPEAVVLTGDLTLNGDRESHVGLIELLKPLQESDIQVFVLPGNHDVEGSAYRFDDEGVHKFAGINTQTFVDLYENFGYIQALSKDQASLSYMVEVSKEIRLLMIDVNGYDLSGKISNETLAWVEEQLTLAQKESATVIGSSHQNVNIHNPLFQYGYQMENADKLLELYEKFNVQLHLSGHMHIQHIFEEHRVTDIATSSMAITPNQYALLQIDERLGMSYTTFPIDVAAWARNHAVNDKNLLYFSEYSRQFFDRTTEFQLTEALEELVIDDKEREQMIEFGIRINREYFTGKLADNDFYKQGLTIWKKNAPNEFFTRYFKSIKGESFEDKNNYFFQK